MKKVIQIGLMSVLLISLVNCHKNCNDPTNPACPDYNPCSKVHSLSADFIIQEYTGNGSPSSSDTSWHYYPTDTVYTPYARFTYSDTTVDSVRWTIGAGSYTSRSFALDFTSIRPTPVPVTLTVYKHRNSCYPTDDTVKTLTKMLYFTDSCYAVGSYHGYFDNNTSDTGTIAIVLVDTGINAFHYHIRGFTPGCDDSYGGGSTNINLFYTSIEFEGGGSLGTCDGATGSLYYNRANGTVEVQFKTVKSLGTSVVWNIHNFNGIKIN